ncbi:hypothetical protein NQ314_005319 [Rhamnusium bicolor]|uniref:Uncharacterized protein n=1 Tax=Rhamnusium bicolor TaxID=1586634 RepID=A0AAV8ZHQ9_9CUCU|nr:hypothetical protein NQ314_005319 [Rhamnusium bicolor]
MSKLVPRYKRICKLKNLKLNNVITLKKSTPKNKENIIKNVINTKRNEISMTKNVKNKKINNVNNITKKRSQIEGNAEEEI